MKEKDIDQFITECAKVTADIYNMLPPDRIFKFSRSERTELMSKLKEFDKVALSKILGFKTKYFEAVAQNPALIEHSRSVEECQDFLVRALSLASMCIHAQELMVAYGPSGGNAPKSPLN